ncbi:MAG TPA: hypothetical protein DEB33_10610 [Gemmatimonadetes bacterium]|nr:hypothetical protein [Gemmatimonadota bacterium]
MQHWNDLSSPMCKWAMNTRGLNSPSQKEMYEMAGIFDMAKDLGNALARTDEYQNLKRASDAAEEDRDLVDLKNRIQSIESELQASLQSGQEPSEELKSSYAKTAEELQAMPAFQRVIAAQTNFEKIMYKVNETVAKGIEEGAQSRIIIAS